MKKILLILLLLISCDVFSQGGGDKLNRLELRDSIYPKTGYAPRINASSYYLNGVLQSFGGGSAFDTTAFLSTYHTWTKNFGMTNTFGFDWTNSSLKSQSDTIVLKNKATIFKTNYGSYLMKVDSTGGVRFYGNAQVDGTLSVLNLTVSGLSDLSDVAFNGSVTTDLTFQKSDYINIGTTDAFGMNLMTNSIARIYIKTDSILNYYPTRINSNLKVRDTIQGNGRQITQLNAGFLDTGYVPMARLRDSVYKISNLDTTRFAETWNTITTSDTSRYGLNDTLKTNDDRAEHNFWNLVKLYAAVVFNGTVTINAVVTYNTAPVFNTLVNFANGLTTTTITASGTATFNGNAVFNGYTKYANGVNEKVYTAKGKLSATGTFSVAHNIPNFKNIEFMSFAIFHDTTAAAQRRMFYSGSNIAAAIAPGANSWSDTTNFNYSLPVTATGLIDDSIYFRAIVTDSY